MNLMLILGLLLSLASCTCLYLASPNQRWITTHWPSRSTTCIGLLLLLVSVFPLRQTLLPATTLFVLFSWVMLLLILMPYTGALLTVFKGEKSNEPR